MKGIDIKEIDHQASRGIAWVGKAALFCLGLLAMLALIIVMTVLTMVMLIATVLPAAAVRQRRDLSVRRDSGNTPQFSAPRKAVAS